MIVLRSPKGWTGPKLVDGKENEAVSAAMDEVLGEMIKRAIKKELEA